MNTCVLPLLRRLSRVAVLLPALAVVTPVFADAIAASRYYEDGLARFEKRDLAGAIIQLKNALQQDRDMLAANLLLARAYLADGDVGPAEVAFREALRLGVNRAEVAVPLARIYLLQGRPERVIETIPADGLPPPVRLEVLTLRAAAYAAVGKRGEAERSFAEARALDPSAPMPRVAEVPMLLAAGRIDLARERAEQAVQLGPTLGSAFTARASVAHASGDVASALRDYQRALELQPGLVDAAIARAALLVDLGRDGEAQAGLEALAASGPTDPRASYLLALLAARGGDQAASDKHLAAVIDVVDALRADWLRGQEQILMVGALAHHAGRQYEKARKYLDMLVTHYPRNLGARKLLASIYLDTGEYARATSLLENVLRDRPDDAQALQLLGRVNLGQKRYAKATELLEKAAQSGDGGALAALGFSRLGQGDAVAAARNLEAAFDKAPGDLGLAITLANTLMRAGDSGKALAVAQRARTALPGNPAALNLLGAVMGAAGDLAGARAAYGDALKLDAGFRPARLNLARLDAAQGRYDDARRTFAELLRKSRRDTVVMYESALLEQRAGRLAEALRWLEKATAENPRDKRVGLALIQVHAAMGNRPAALESARALAARHHDDIAVLAALAQAQIDAEDRKGAQHTLRDLTRIAEFDPDAQVRVGYLQLAAGNPAGAQYSVEKALGGRPGDLRALVLGAEAALVAQDLEVATTLAKELTRTHPSSAEGARVAGEVAMMRKQWALAVDHFRQAYEREPSRALLLRRISALAHQGSPSAGVALLETWLRTRQDDVPARKALAELRMAEGNWPAARQEYEALIGGGVRDPIVYNNLANVLLELKDPSALQIAREAQRLDSRSAGILDTLGWTLAAAGQIDEAMSVLREARLRDPQSVDIRFHLASMLARQGRKDEARIELRGVLDTVDRARLQPYRADLLQTLGL